MSPASKGDDPGAQERDTAAEVTAGAADADAEEAAADAEQAATDEVPETADSGSAEDTDAAAAEETAAEETAAEDTAAEDTAAEEAAAEEAAAEGAEVKPARRRAAAAPASEAEPAAKPAARSASRTAKSPAKAPAKKAKAKASSTEVKVDLPADIFDTKVNVPLIHQVVVAHEAAARQGTHATKTRGDVRGGGRKPYRQKGTGRARQGSVRAPQFTGGGIVHGPVSRSHAVRTPKKMKAAALRGALSDRARHGLVQVVDGFLDGDSPKTGHAVSVLAAVTGLPAGTTSVLVVADRSDQLTWKSLRNVRGVHVIDPGQLNTYDVLVRDRVVFTKPAFESFVARVGKQEDEQR
jgi:large subunit ribosomal protein L4